MGNAIGLGVLAVLVASTASLVPESQVQSVLWVFIYLAIAAMGLFMWNSEKYSQSTGGWLGILVVGAVLGLLFFVVDIVIGQVFHPELSLFEGARRVGGMFGFAFTVTVMPAIIFVALGGVARGIYVSSRK